MSDSIAGFSSNWTVRNGATTEPNLPPGVSAVALRSLVEQQIKRMDFVSKDGDQFMLLCFVSFRLGSFAISILRVSWVPVCFPTKNIQNRLRNVRLRQDLPSGLDGLSATSLRPHRASLAALFSKQTRLGGYGWVVSECFRYRFFILALILPTRSETGSLSNNLQGRSHINS